MIENPAEIENRLLNGVDQLEKRTSTYGKRAQEAAEAEAEYKVAYARAFVRITDADPKLAATKAEQRATLQVEQELRKAKLASSVASYALESVRSARDEINALQSVSASVRATYQATR